MNKNIKLGDTNKSFKMGMLEKNGIVEYWVSLDASPCILVGREKTPIRSVCSGIAFSFGLFIGSILLALKYIIFVTVSKIKKK
jgi:hypothetical protein